MTPTLAIIVIGRNEGARLERCLDSLAGEDARLIYVDSGSSDGSADLARGRGIETVDLAPPFTAARARNMGVAALGPDLPDLLQFFDGDCVVEPGWIAAACAALAADPGLGLVTGWRSEIAPGTSVFNRMADAEWHRPAGPIAVCGGDLMVRAEAFRATGGFDPEVIAAEDDDFCLRLAKAGWRLERLPLAMTRHDMAMTMPRAFWQRARRSGHGFAQVGARHPPHLARERRRAWFYGAAVPALLMAGLVLSPWLILAAVAIWAASWARTMRGLIRGGMPRAEAAHQAAWLLISKIPNLLGILTYHLRRLRKGTTRIIEYK